jgi:hypothetical protein
MPKIPGNHEPEPAQRPWEKQESIESDADYRRRAKAAEKWFAEKRYLEGLNPKGKR